jgi:hypothetical protein
MISFLEAVIALLVGAFTKRYWDMEKREYGGSDRELRALQNELRISGVAMPCF